MQVSVESAEILRLSAFMDKGVLPFGGGLYEQPAVLLSAFSVVQEEQGLIQTELAKQAQKAQTKRL